VAPSCSPRRQLHVAQPIGGAPLDITELHSAILHKNIVVAKADTEMICERLTFDAVVSGRLPPSAQSPARAYNSQGSAYP
jgi:hypothetical protein